MKQWFSRRKTPIIWLTCLVLFVAMIQIELLYFHYSGSQAMLRLDHIEHILEENKDKKRLGLSKTHHLVAVSFITEGLGRYLKHFPKEKQRVNLLLEKLVESALDPQNGKYNLYKKSTWGENNLYLSHVAVILLNYEKISGDDQYGQLLSSIVEHLENKLSVSTVLNIRSYERSSSIWPADNSVIYNLIHDYKSLRGEAYNQELYRRWISFMNGEASDSLGLHISELTENEYYSGVPRGCALSWSCTYMCAYDKEEAQNLWKKYKGEMKVPLFLFAGFREYPPKRTKAADGDSGPVILGVGGGATGLALVGAAENNDYISYYQLNNTMKLIEIGAVILKLFGKSEVDAAVNGLLATSIKFRSDVYMF